MRILNHRVCNRKEKQMSEEKNLEGIGGWLVIVALGLVITPVRIIILIITTYPEIFSTGVWEALTTQGSDSYNPLWAPILIGEVLINIALISVWIYMGYLFIKRKKVFPNWYISIAVFSLVYIMIMLHQRIAEQLVIQLYIWRMARL